MLTYYSGLPYSKTQGGAPVAPIDGYRLPDFWRVDARLEKRFRIVARGEVSVVLEGLNVTLNRETVGVECEPVVGRADRCTPRVIGPISVPSLGVEATY